MIHEKKVGATERSRSLNPGKAIAMAICPIARARWYWMFKVACEFACAVKMRRTRTSSIKTQHSGTDRSFWICVWRKLGQGNHLIILTPLFLKSSVFSKKFFRPTQNGKPVFTYASGLKSVFKNIRFQNVSVHMKTKSPRFQIPPVWRAFSKSSVFAED